MTAPEDIRCAFCDAKMESVDGPCPGCGGYPEHTKLRKVQAQSQACGEFLEWLQSEKGYTLCKPHKHDDSSCYVPDPGNQDIRLSSRIRICDLRMNEYLPTYVSRDRLLAEFFGIDVDKLEKEKRRLLDEANKYHDRIVADMMQDKGAG